MEKTPQEIEQLKQEWSLDTCWDIEDTEGFEDHREELKAFRLECEAKWAKQYIEHEIRTNPHQGAFARPVSSLSGEETSSDQKGLTKREYFAAMAMQGVLSSGFTVDKDTVAMISLGISDALLEKLAKTSR